MKSQLRSDVRCKLRALSPLYIENQSNIILSKLLKFPGFISCSTLSIYLSMNNEVNTFGALHAAFANNKKVFVPKIIGKCSKDMVMLEIECMDTIYNFPKNSWGIPEPTADFFNASSDVTNDGILELVIVPGLAFDSFGGRIGHGKGYYGNYNDI